MSLKNIDKDYALKVLMAGINVEDKESLKQGLQELIGSSSSEGVDWNENDEASPSFIKNRPFYSTYEPVEGITIEWDGNKEGHVLSEPNGHYIKVSDMVLTDEQLKRMSFTTSDGSVTSFENGYFSEDISYYGDWGPAIVKKVGVSVPGGSPDTFPETGVYFQSSQRSLYSEAYASETIHALDKKYLPTEISELTTNITELTTNITELQDSLANKMDKAELQDSFANKMDKTNPVGTGSFSMNRKSDSIIGSSSFSEGWNTTASELYSHAEGYETIASGETSHAEGYETRALGGKSHAEGYNTEASGGVAHAEGTSTVASGKTSHAEGMQTTASGDHSHAEGMQTTASGNHSHAEGSYTTAESMNQHAQGRYNIPDPDGKYAHIVGNGTAAKNSNAHTLDWDGNAWFAGTVEGTAIILPSTTESSTKKFRITVDDSGTISATEITG